MHLTDTAIRKAKPADKVQRLFDAGGLYLEIAKTGGKWWRLKYRFDGKEKRLSLGTYPDTSLASARDKRDAARKLLAASVDPGEHRKAEKLAGEEQAANSFEVIAREWLAKYSPTWAASTGEQDRLAFRARPFPVARQASHRHHHPQRTASRRPSHRRPGRDRNRTPRTAELWAGVPLRYRHRPGRTQPGERPARRSAPDPGSGPPCRHRRPCGYRRAAVNLPPQNGRQEAILSSHSGGSHATHFPSSLHRRFQSSSDPAGRVARPS